MCYQLCLFWVAADQRPQLQLQCLAVQLPTSAPNCNASLCSSQPQLQLQSLLCSSQRMGACAPPPARTARFGCGTCAPAPASACCGATSRGLAACRWRLRPTSWSPHQVGKQRRTGIACGVCVGGCGALPLASACRDPFFPQPDTQCAGFTYLLKHAAAPHGSPYVQAASPAAAAQLSLPTCATLSLPHPPSPPNP